MDDKFPAFAGYVDSNDFVTCERDGFTLRATLYLDDTADRPDERMDGFWPNLEPGSPGYIGPESESTLRRHMKRARAIMAAWKRDKWRYYGVAVTVQKNGIPLTGRYDHAVWGIEGNYPGGDNRYLAETANDLVDEALSAAKEAIKKICDHD